jgi:hypothetical protein
MCSVALEPRADHYRWGIYSAKGGNTPVQHVAVNLGASGDMRDPQGSLWLGYPRPRLPADRAAMGFTLDLKVEFFSGGEYVSHGAPLQTAAGPECQVRSSFAHGVKRCVLPLRGETDGPGEYTIRLYFPPIADAKANKAICDIKLQGNVVSKASDLAQIAQGVPLEFTGIRVDRNLELEFIRADDTTMPVLSGFEAICASSATGAKTRQVAQQ